MTRIIHFIAAHWLTLSMLCLIAITVLSLWPADALPVIPGTDKTHHLIAYACLVLPLALSRPRYWLFIVLAFIAWSGAIELIQPYVNRYAEWLDLLANVAGIACGMMLAAVLRRTAHL